MFIFINPILNDKDEYEQQQYSSDLLKSYICVYAHANVTDREKLSVSSQFKSSWIEFESSCKILSESAMARSLCYYSKASKFGSVAQLVRAGDS